MSALDTRPRWLLRKQARISSHRLSRTGVRPDRLDLATWWRQIGEAASDLGLDAGQFDEWHVQPEHSVVGGDGPLL